MLFQIIPLNFKVENLNYLLPIDLRNSDLQDADDLRRDALPLNDVMERMREAGTNNIVILDACRDNPFLAKLSRSASRGLAKVITPSSTSILYSTDPGNTASDGASGDNGIFTKRLVETIRKEGLELVDVMREVSQAVTRDTNGSQRPVFDGVMGTKFFFRTSDAPAQTGVSSISVDQQVVDLRYWESAERSNTISAYRIYLKKFPAGDFAEMAADKIRLLEQANQSKEVVAKVAPTTDSTANHKQKKKLFIESELTMQDNNAGLMWVKNGGLTGNITFNSALVFIDNMNSKGYGGHNDWRLPTRTELETLIGYAKKDGWGNEKGHYVSDYLVSKGFINIQPEYYLTNNKYPPAQPGVLRLLPPQRGLIAIGKSQNPFHLGF